MRKRIIWESLNHMRKQKSPYPLSLNYLSSYISWCFLSLHANSGYFLGSFRFILKESLSYFLWDRSTNESLSICLSLKVLLLLQFWRIAFLDIDSLIHSLFFQYIITLPLSLPGSCWEGSISYRWWVAFFLLLSRSSLGLGLWKFDYTMSSCVFLRVYPTWMLLNFLSVYINIFN